MNEASLLEALPMQSAIAVTVEANGVTDAGALDQAIVHNEPDNALATGVTSVRANYPTEPRATEKRSSSTREEEVVEIDFLNLNDGRLLELVEHPENPSRTLLALFSEGTVQYLEKFEHHGRIFLPLQRNNEVLKQIRLPNAASPFDSLQALMRRIETFIFRCVRIGDCYISVLADFVLSTWFIDRLSVASYLSVVGLSQSGKTTLLTTLSLLCRRSLFISDITSASFYRACTQFMPTILIDEAATIANNRQLRHMLRTGTTQDVVAVRGNTFHAYGAKVMSWLELPNDPALNSRCILIPMVEATQPLMFEPTQPLANPSDPEIRRSATALQAQLLQYRLENYDKVKSAPIKGDERFRPRCRDLFRALCAASLQDPERSEALFNFFRHCYAVPLEPLGTEQNAVLLTIFSLIHSREYTDSLLIGDLTKKVNHCLELSGARLRLQPRKVGAILTSLGLTNRSRGNSGCWLHLENEDVVKIHDLAKNYGIDKTSEQILREPNALCPYGSPRDWCPFCDAAKKAG